MAGRFPTPDSFPNLSLWARALVTSLEQQLDDPAGTFLTPQPVALSYRYDEAAPNLGQERAVVPGILMYDNTNDLITYSNGSSWTSVATLYPSYTYLQEQVVNPAVTVGYATLFVDTNNDLRVLFSDGTLGTVTIT
jgi:hypothetical protein